MRRAAVFIDAILAGELRELERGKEYHFVYNKGYKGPSLSLTMPTTQHRYTFDRFPPFFEGLLPEGWMLDGLLFYGKMDRDDYFTQLITVGGDMVGNVTVYPCP